MWLHTAARWRSARVRCSPTGGCPARRSCSCRPTGGTESRSRSTFSPTPRPSWLAAAKRDAPTATLARQLPLPARLAETLAARLELTQPLGALTDKALAAAEARLARWPFEPNGTEGYRQGGGDGGWNQHRRAVRVRHCKPKPCRACMPSARRSMSRDGSAATTFNGRGRAAGPRRRRSDHRNTHDLRLRCPPLSPPCWRRKGYDTPTPVQAAVLEEGRGRPRPARLRPDRVGQDGRVSASPWRPS